MKKYITNGFEETKELGEIFAKEVLRLPPQESAIVLCLSGNLGGGKTTFLQGFAKGLGIKQKITSPTFVIQKRFEVKNKKLKNFYHIDCYRLKNHEDVLELDFKNIIFDPKNIIAVEWPEKIKKVLPRDIIEINFKFIDNDKREIKFKI